MISYIIRRLLLIIPMLLGISLITLLLMHFSPADPASIRYGLNPEVSGSARAQFRELYNLDKPVLVQFGLWLKRVVKLDFGNSFIDDVPVIKKIGERLPATLLLGIISILVIYIIAIPLGVSSAVRANSFYDKIVTVAVFIGYATPAFWFALLLIMLFGIHLGWFPISGMRPWYVEYYSFFGALKDLLWRLVLPVAATSLVSLAGISRYMRSSMLEALGQDYVRTARAKGLKESRVVYKHALRNALLPIVTIASMILPALIGGSFIIETIFAWPGMGRMGYEAIMNYDYPVVMGVGVIATFLTLLGLILADIMYAWVDPRIRYE
ncbi:MAG: ABC transporter permease [Candidatus Omnitrophica bacterium]|nr:ABC transporter permease [Candidatus Omnitrophota bacterium]MBU4488573.1 ABC transporter permease [Candidatus Omnitrophota bacterium]MCG2704453.1 ABC transporter permease [Candidatus Omnitrophota bacterium]